MQKSSFIKTTEKLILLFTIVLLSSFCKSPDIKKVPPRKVKQYIKILEVVDKKQLKVSFRVYLNKKYEDKSHWKITPFNTIISVTNISSRGRRSGTYTVQLAKPLRYGIKYQLNVGTTMQKEITPPFSKYLLFPGGKKKALIMSYDDGNIQDKRLVKLFNKYKIKGSFHLNSAKLGIGNYLKKEEIKSLYRGHEVSCHTLNHPDLSHLTKEDIIHQVGEDRKALEKLMDTEVCGLAYPFGGYNDKVIKILKLLGIKYARTVKNTGSLDKFLEDFLAWHPSCHQTQMMFLGDKLLKWNNNEMALLFVWGHSWEFDNGGANNNWAYVKKFCKRIGKKKDIWYATIIQMIDYLNAIKKLRFSQNSTVVHNPTTNPTIWIANENGKKATSLKPGAEMKLR